MDDGDIDPLQKKAFFERLKYRNLLNDWYGSSYASREVSAYGKKVRHVGDFLGDVTKQVFSAISSRMARWMWRSVLVSTLEVASSRISIFAS